MQKRMNSNSGFQLPQMNVSRVGRKVFLTGEINEDSIHELIRILAEIESEDNEQQPQEKVEILINDFMTVVDLKKKNKFKGKELYEELNDSIDTYNSNSSLDREPIQLYISSRGGDIEEATAYIDYIQTMNTPVHAIAIGKTMSAGALMLLASDRRFATQNVNILIHQLKTGMFGTYQDLEEEMIEIRRINDLVNELILTYTKVDEEMLNDIQIFKYDYYMTAEEALELGIIDEII